MRIVKHSHLSADAIKTLCIRQEYFKHGTNEQYKQMLDMCEDINANAEWSDGTISDCQIYAIACEIARHSDIETTEEVQSIMFEVNRAIAVTFEIIK